MAWHVTIDDCGDPTSSCSAWTAADPASSLVSTLIPHPVALSSPEYIFSLSILIRYLIYQTGLFNLSSATLVLHQVPHPLRAPRSSCMVAKRMSVPFASGQFASEQLSQQRVNQKSERTHRADFHTQRTTDTLGLSYNRFSILGPPVT